MSKLTLYLSSLSLVVVALFHSSHPHLSTSGYGVGVVPYSSYSPGLPASTQYLHQPQVQVHQPLTTDHSLQTHQPFLYHAAPAHGLFPFPHYYTTVTHYILPEPDEDLTPQIKALVQIIRKDFLLLGKIAIEDDPIVGHKINHFLTGEIVAANDLLLEYGNSKLKGLLDKEEGVKSRKKRAPDSSGRNVRAKLGAMIADAKKNSPDFDKLSDGAKAKFDAKQNESIDACAAQGAEVCAAISAKKNKVAAALGKN